MCKITAQGKGITFATLIVSIIFRLIKSKKVMKINFYEKAGLFPEAEGYETIFYEKVRLLKDADELEQIFYGRVGLFKDMKKLEQIYNMRLLYHKYPICETLSHKLSWSHYYELLKIDDDLARQFYEKQAIVEDWTIRELRRQKKTGLFHRIAIGKDKEKILKLSKQGQIVKSEEDFIKNPHIFEFMNFPENYEYTETDIEKGIINNLQKFLLELGKGFAFIGRQQRLTLNSVCP